MKRFPPITVSSKCLKLIFTPVSQLLKNIHYAKNQIFHRYSCFMSTFKDPNMLTTIQILFLYQKTYTNQTHKIIGHCPVKNTTNQVCCNCELQHQISIHFEDTNRKSSVKYLRVFFLNYFATGTMEY